jgi:hypothetical protein
MNSVWLDVGAANEILIIIIGFEQTMDRKNHD